MSSTDRFDTIVAPATPDGRSAIAVVRLDGMESRQIVESLAGRALEPRIATHVALSDAGDPLDDAVVVFHQAPRSYTGNDLVEVSLHGSPLLVARLVRAAGRRGARIAEPGEFTERAVMNGKLDLVQAEAIVDLIASRTALQAKLSLRNLSGDLSLAADRLRVRLIDVISRLEAALDFSEEGYEFISRGEADTSIEAAIRETRALAATIARGRATNDGLTAVILGRPNAGKSTLLNFLCGTERAIVTPIPGTTRDLLRESVEIGGLPVTLVDTAGLRSDAELVEEIGIGRAREAASRAEIILYLVDAAEGLGDEDLRELSGLVDPVLVYTKVDLAAAPSDGIGISVKGRLGLEELLERLDRLVRERYGPEEGTPTIVNERQHAALAEANDALVASLETLRAGAREEIVVIDLYRAANSIGTLTGAISRDDIYREIFSRFCIGK